jgi:uncharacterized MnhB-related membrane protein
MEFILVGVGILACAVMALIARRLLISAVWLALTSALVALLLYMLGGPHIAVIELSVGAGLVTVLFVFAINISGEEVIDAESVLPKPYAWGSIGIAAGLALFLILKTLGIVSFAGEITKTSIINWDSRYLDIILQVVLIFAGVLGVIGILAPGKNASSKEDQE